MNRYFFFQDSGDDAACYPVERLISMTCATNATLLMNFESSLGKSDGGDTVTLTITADKEREVMKSIVEAATAGPPFILIADDVQTASSVEDAAVPAGIYLSSNITAVTITLDT